MGIGWVDYIHIEKAFFYNGAKEIQEQYMRMYQFDYKKSCCSKFDFEFKQLD